MVWGWAGGQSEAHHAGGDTAGPGTDHLISDLAAPELLAVGVGQEGQGRLLQLVRGLVGWRDRGGHEGSGALIPPALPH